MSPLDMRLLVPRHPAFAEIPPPVGISAAHSSRVTRTLAWLAAIVLGAAPAAYGQTSWAIDPKPILDIPATTAGGNVVIETISGATRLSNGTLVVADERASRLRFFDPAGNMIRAVGQRGTGPGDFRRLMWAGQCATDSIFAWDYSGRRMSVFDASGKVVRQFPLAVKRPGSTPPGTVACSRTGQLAIQPIGTWGNPHVIVTPDSTVMRARTPVSLTDRTGQVTAELGEIWARELYTVHGSDRLNAAGYRPLGRTTSIAVAANRIYVGTADSDAVDAFGLDGRRISTLKLGIAPRRVTRTHLDEAVGEESAIYPSTMQDQLRRLLLAIETPVQLPPYTGLFTDPSDVLWAVAMSRGDTVTRLVAVDSNGRRLADLLVPFALTVFEIGRDYVLASYPDGNDEQHLALFRLRR